MSIDKVRKAIAIINQHQDDADFEGVKEEHLIDLAEKKLGVEFSDSYRFFLKNLGCGDLAGCEFYGIINADFTNSGIPDAIWLTIKERQESNLPNQYVIINSTGDGDYYVLDCSKDTNKKGEVSLWSPGVKDNTSTFNFSHDDFGDFFYEQVTATLN